MSYKEFEKLLISNLKDKIGKKYELRVGDFNKKNTVLRGMSFIKIPQQPTTASPIVYLDNYFVQYSTGVLALGDICDEIIDIVDSAPLQFVDNFAEVCDIAFVKDKIFPKLCNASMNKDLLKKQPHTDYLDLSFVYIVRFKQDDMMFDLTVSYELLNTWGISIEELHDIAIANSLADVKLCSIISILAETRPDAAAELSNLPKLDLYVCTNIDKNLGAANAFNKEVLAKFASDFCCNRVAIIPSSIHEGILVPVNQNIDHLHFIASMVKEVNRTEVLYDEILSNNLYLYNAVTKEIGIFVP